MTKYRIKYFKLLQPAFILRTFTLNFSTISAVVDFAYTNLNEGEGYIVEEL
jgi:hypothetical protein